MICLVRSPTRTRTGRAKASPGTLSGTENPSMWIWQDQQIFLHHNCVILATQLYNRGWRPHNGVQSSCGSALWESHRRTSMTCPPFEQCSSQPLEQPPLFHLSLISRCMCLLLPGARQQRDLRANTSSLPTNGMVKWRPWEPADGATFVATPTARTFCIQGIPLHLMTAETVHVIIQPFWADTIHDDSLHWVAGHLHHGSIGHSLPRLLRRPVSLDRRMEANTSKGQIGCALACMPR